MIHNTALTAKRIAEVELKTLSNQQRCLFSSHDFLESTGALLSFHVDPGTSLVKVIKLFCPN